MGERREHKMTSALFNEMEGTYSIYRYVGDVTVEVAH